ncbi:MAG: serpin family protein [Clostridia bacterium]
MKRFEKLFVIVFVVIFSSILLVSCTGIKADKVSKEKKIMSTENLNSNLLSEKNQNSLLGFSGEIINRNYKKDTNLLISPISIYLALAMLTNAANGETLTQMLTSLGCDQEEINTYCGYLYSLYAENPDNIDVVGIANSIWYNENNLGYTPKDSFLDINSTYYGAEIYKADFTKKRTVTDINNWVDNKTNGNIDKIISSIDPMVIMYLINTLSFENQWDTYFSSTEKGNFTNFDGKNVNAKYIKDKLLTYYDSGKALAFSYPFKNRRFSFLGILPNGDINTYLSEFDGEELANLLKNQKGSNVTARVPCFSYKYDTSLNESLIGMGMSSMFNNADFSNGWDVDVGEVKVADILHKTFIEVDKNGLKAAAATKVEMRCTSGELIGVSGNITINLDRPFMYAIMDMQYNVPLFIGVTGEVD